MNLDSFVPAYNNKFVDVDYEFGPQCWDLVEWYAEIVLKIPKNPWAITLGPQGYAMEAWTVFDSHLQKYFVKVPGNQAQRGDINVYGPHGAFLAGHINIELGGGQVFEQNADPDASPAHISTRPTTYLLGSLRFKGADMPPDPNQINQLVTLCWGPGAATQPDITKLNAQATLQAALNLILGDGRTAAWDKRVYQLEANQNGTINVSINGTEYVPKGN